MYCAMRSRLGGGLLGWSFPERAVLRRNTDRWRDVRRIRLGLRRRQPAQRPTEGCDVARQIRPDRLRLDLVCLPARAVVGRIQKPRRVRERLLREIERRPWPFGWLEHRLARPAADISLADIIRAIDGPLVGVRGERPEKVGYSGAAEPLQTVWIALRANERAILEEVTLQDIVTRNLPPRVRELAEDPRAWASGPA